jgi:2,3-dihydroxy-p-cumate/2,3-dihydroxybenzoate 3,4-dioxygenase
VVRPPGADDGIFHRAMLASSRFTASAFVPTDHSRDLTFWRALGAEVSDWVGDIAYLRIDGLHHRVALYPSARNGLLLCGIRGRGARSDHAEQLLSCRKARSGSCKGPGREAASQQMFLHVEGPDGLIFLLCERHV